MRCAASISCLTISAILGGCAPAPEESAAPPVATATSWRTPPAPLPTGLASQGQALATGSTRLLNVVAHQDDDILVTSPDLFNAVRAGAAVQTVVLTAGENNASAHEDTCDAYVRGRELGQRLAWEVMAEQELGGDWGAPALVTLPTGVQVRAFSLPGKPLSILYLGLRNSHHKDLQALWNDRSGELAVETRPDPELPTQTYTRELLIESLHAIIDAFAPTQLSTLDAGKTKTLDFPLEHPDHVHGALFTLAALERRPAQVATALRMYRSYNAVLEPANVSSLDVRNKRALFEAYAPHDGFLCEGVFSSLCSSRPIICNNPLNLVYEQFLHRQYPVHVLRDVSGPLRGPGARCLVVNGPAEPGSPLALSPCGPDAPPWSLSAEGTLEHQGSGLCVSYVGSEPRGALLALTPCDPSSPAQRFALNGWGQLRGPDASCVSAAEATQLSFAECDNLPEQLGFHMQFEPPFTASRDFDVSQLSARPSQAGSLSYGDLDGDGDADVCARRGDGVYCAVNEAGSFGGFARRLAGFGDPSYDSAATGGTLALADVNGDGRADLCLRSERGIECAHGQASGDFGSISTRTTAFDRWSGFGSHAAYYGSLGFADVNGDGKADVCGRNRAGVECALASASGDGSFGPREQWLRDEFSDMLGWFVASSGSTLQFGDVDGDGKQDVCGRASAGIVCAHHGGSGFERPHLWSDTGDFSDGEGWGMSAARYGSIRLGDIDGDGKADVCGRGPQGVLCALSMGQSFAAAQPIFTPDPFGDAGGYGLEAYGASLALLRLDGDQRTDVCLRGPLAEGGVGLRCAHSF